MLVSSIVDQIVPRVSLPLIQIGMGVVIALFAPTAISIELNPDLFLVLFIAPLLYDEAKNADRASLWSNRKPILSLAIGLVVVTTLVIGFALHAIIPSIPLAVAFALGAALGPTDAVAVTSLSKQIDIPDRQKGILSGELLLNDASGIVSFQFALAAAITGSFSLAAATANFAVEFFGGLALGAVLGLLGKAVAGKAQSIGVENTTFHVLLELLTPLLVYLLASSCHVSGIIAVVVAGLINVISPRMIGPSIARMNIVSSSVWHVLAFALNGIVFVLLGTQLPHAMQYSWEDASINNGLLVVYVLGLTLVLFAVRFVWVLVMDLRFAKKKQRRFSTEDVRTSLLTTLCGAKGTITLSILFTIPAFLSNGERFPQRDLVIFLACGVILCTLLVATFIVPLIAPKAEKPSEKAVRDEEVSCYVEVIRNVIEELAAHRTPENRRETRQVIKAYHQRLQRIKEANDIDDDPNTDLRIRALQWEAERAFDAMAEGGVSGIVGYRHLNRLQHMENLLLHAEGRICPRYSWMKTRALFRRGIHALVRELPNSNVTGLAEEARKLQIDTELFAIAKLEELVASSEVPTENVTSLLMEYHRNVATLRNSLPAISTNLKASSRSDEVKRFAYQQELEQIQSMYEEGKLSRSCAKRLRENVHLMQLDLDNEF